MAIKSDFKKSIKYLYLTIHKVQSQTISSHPTTSHNASNSTHQNTPYPDPTPDSVHKSAPTP